MIIRSTRANNARMDLDEPIFGPKLLKLRRSKGLRQAEVARLAQLDPSYLAKLEAGRRGVPMLDVFGRLIQALEASRSQTEALAYYVAIENALTAIPAWAKGERADALRYLLRGVATMPWREVVVLANVVAGFQATTRSEDLEKEVEL